VLDVNVTGVLRSEEVIEKRARRLPALTGKKKSEELEEREKTF